MPHMTWKHICPESGNKLIWLGKKNCPSCGRKGKCDGFGLTGIEAMGNFQRLTGLPAIGPHKPQMPDYSEQCPVCNGRSIIEIHQWNRWVSCRSCNGTGAIITVSEEKFIEIQSDAWKIFDDWRLEKADKSKRDEIAESQNARVYKKIYKRDHYRPRRNRRTLRYFAKMNMLMSDSLDRDYPENKTLHEVGEGTVHVCERGTLGELFKHLIAYILITKVMYFLFTFWN
jgi:hypothetical protein